MNIVMVGSIEHDESRMAKLADRINNVLPIFNSVTRENKVIYPTRRESEKERLIDAHITYIKHLTHADVLIAFPKKIFIEDIGPDTQVVKYAFGESTTYELAMATCYCVSPILVMNAFNGLEELDLDNIVDIDYVMPDREEKENE